MEELQRRLHDALRVRQVSARQASIDATKNPNVIGNILSGADPEAVAAAMRLVLGLPAEWQAPPEYLTPAVSRIVTRIVLGRLSLRRHQ